MLSTIIWRRAAFSRSPSGSGDTGLHDRARRQFHADTTSGDIAVSIAGPNATSGDVAIIRKNYGFDRPLPVQFIDWEAHAAHGDLGRSYLYHASVAGPI